MRLDPNIEARVQAELRRISRRTTVETFRSVSDRAQLAAGRVPQFALRTSLLRRGGYPASSMGDGRASAETPVPGLDRVDRAIAADAFTIAHHAHLSLALLDQAAVLMDRWTALPLRVNDRQALERENAPRWCENLMCSREIPQGQRTCDRCRKHFSKHGFEWPYLPDGQMVRGAAA